METLIKDILVFWSDQPRDGGAPDGLLTHRRNSTET